MARTYQLDFGAVVLDLDIRLDLLTMLLDANFLDLRLKIVGPVLLGDQILNDRGVHRLQVFDLLSK